MLSVKQHLPRLLVQFMPLQIHRTNDVLSAKTLARRRAAPKSAQIHSSNPQYYYSLSCSVANHPPYEPAMQILPKGQSALCISARHHQTVHNARDRYDKSLDESCITTLFRLKITSVKTAVPHHVRWRQSCGMLSMTVSLNVRVASYWVMKFDRLSPIHRPMKPWNGIKKTSNTNGRIEKKKIVLFPCVVPGSQSI